MGPMFQIMSGQVKCIRCQGMREIFPGPWQMRLSAYSNVTEGKGKKEGKTMNDQTKRWSCTVCNEKIDTANLHNPHTPLTVITRTLQKHLQLMPATNQSDNVCPLLRILHYNCNELRRRINENLRFMDNNDIRFAVIQETKSSRLIRLDRY